MSSGYISAAELERRRQAELERQRQERLRKILEATELYNECINQYEDFNTLVSSTMQRELQVLVKEDELDFACKSFIEVKKHIEIDIAKQKSIPLPNEPEEIKILIQSLSITLNDIKKRYGDGISAFSNRLNLL